MAYEPPKLQEEKLQPKRNLHMINLTCTVCGKEFQALNKGGRWYKGTCSPECRAERARINGNNFKQRRRERAISNQNIGISSANSNMPDNVLGNDILWDNSRAGKEGRAEVQPEMGTGTCP